MPNNYDTTCHTLLLEGFCTFSQAAYEAGSASKDGILIKNYSVNFHNDFFDFFDRKNYFSALKLLLNILMMLKYVVNAFSVDDVQKLQDSSCV